MNGPAMKTMRHETRGAARPGSRLLLAGTMMTLTLGIACGGGDGGGDPPPDGPTAPVAGVQTVRSYPHDPEAFTQGLLFHGGKLYESTGRYGESSLREVELETGRVVRKVDVPAQYFAEGLALLDGKLHQLTWQQGTGFIYDLAGFQQTGTFPYDGEGWGLTTDGRSLILSDGSNVLRFIDPETHEVRRTLDVKDGGEFIHQLNELEWVRGEIWANVWHDERIARIHPETGRVIGWLDLSGILPDATRGDPEAVLNGIAYDAENDRIFVTGKLWPLIFEIRVPDLVAQGSASTGG